MSNKGIIELHCHTKMSEGRGLISPSELVKYAYDNGYKAIAITDCGNVQAFPEAYREWSKLWKQYQEECRDIGKTASQEDFLKIVYGLEGNLLTEEGKVFPVLIYAKNEKGLKNLYKIVTVSYLEFFDKIPLIPRKYLDEHRDGLIVGSVCDGGEVFTAVNSEEYNAHPGIYSEVEIASYYDFLEMVPYDISECEYGSKFTRYLCYEAMNIKARPMIITSDAYYISEDDKAAWDILTDDRKVFCKRPRHLMDYREQCKEQFIDWRIGSPEILAKNADMLFENRAKIEEQIEYLNPLRIGKYFDEADATIKQPNLTRNVNKHVRRD